MTDAFYDRDGDDFIASPLTRGPWSEKHQHGGPPSALIASAIDGFVAPEKKTDPREGRHFLARLTVEFLRPVTVGRVSVTCEMIKAGSKVQRVGARLTVDGEECMRASAIRIRQANIELPPRPPALLGEPLCARQSSQPYTLPFFSWHPSYVDAVEVRIARGKWGETPIDVWMHPRQPLIAGEALTPLAALLICVDAESGIGPPVDPRTHSYLNPDLTVYFERAPRGEWIGLRTRSTAETMGTGLSQSEVHDEDGIVARGLQALVVEKRTSK